MFQSVTKKIIIPQPFFKTFAGKNEKAMFLNGVASAFKYKNAIPTIGRNCIFFTCQKVEKIYEFKNKKAIGNNSLLLYKLLLQFIRSATSEDSSIY